MSEKSRAIVVFAAIIIVVGGYFAWTTMNAVDPAVAVNYRAPVVGQSAK